MVNSKFLYLNFYSFVKHKSNSKKIFFDENEI